MIYIVRHGQTDWNKLSLIQSHADIPLNDNGRQQAKEIKGKLSDVNFDYAFSSPLSRAVETAKIITSAKLIIDERLIEVSNGIFEGKTCAEARKIKHSDGYREEDYGVESDESVMKRVDSFMTDLFDKFRDKDILIATHAGTCAIIRVWFEGEPPEGVSFCPKNCEICCYDYSKKLIGRIF